MRKSTNPFRYEITDRFEVGETDFALLLGQAAFLRQLVDLFCVRGGATLTINHLPYKMTQLSELMIMPDVRVTLEEVEPGSVFRYFTCSKSLLVDAYQFVAPHMYEFRECYSVFQHTPSTLEWANANYRLMKILYEKTDNPYRVDMFRNLLQNHLMLIEIPNYFDNIDREGLKDKRRSYLRQFMADVHDYGNRERQLDFYVRRLKISKRYLTMIVTEQLNMTPKAFIDEYAVIQIKNLLETTSLSMNEIATQMNFPDQSYLGRFFKKATGMALSEYRRAWTTAQTTREPGN